MIIIQANLTWHRTGSEKLHPEDTEDFPKLLIISLPLSWPPSSCLESFALCVYMTVSATKFTSCSVLLSQGVSAGSELLCAAATGGMAAEMLRFWEIVSCILSLPYLRRENCQSHLICKLLWKIKIPEFIFGHEMLFILQELQRYHHAVQVAQELKQSTANITAREFRHLKSCGYWTLLLRDNIHMQHWGS